MRKENNDLNKTKILQQETNAPVEQTKMEDLLQVESETVEQKDSQEKVSLNNNKHRISVLYIIAVGLFVIALFLLIAAMVICLVENSKEHNSFFATLFSTISAGVALLGIIFVCVSKDKEPKQKKAKKKKNKKNKSKHMKSDDVVANLNDLSNDDLKDREDDNK